MEFRYTLWWINEFGYKINCCGSREMSHKQCKQWYRANAAWMRTQMEHGDTFHLELHKF